MFDSHASTSAKHTTLTVPKNTFARVAPVSDSEAAGLENKIRERAHQLYEDRGREPGKDQQDWIQAEHEILNQRPSTRIVRSVQPSGLPGIAPVGDP